MSSIGLCARLIVSASRFGSNRLPAILAFVCLLNGLAYGSASAPAP